MTRKRPETPSGATGTESRADSVYYSLVGTEAAGFRKHTVHPAATPEMGFNDVGMPEGYLLYLPGRDKGNQLEFAVDLVLDTQMLRQAGYQFEPAHLHGVNMMCAKCKSALFLRTHSHPGGGSFTIHVHWDRLIESTQDRRIRPAISVQEPIRCDMSQQLITGIRAPQRQGAVICNWIGRAEEGRLYDVEPMKKPLLVKP